MKTTTNFHTLRMVQMALFIAIIILMAFTPIGYIKTGGLEITLLVIPVTVGAIILGPVHGAILGGVFGITSFIQCFGLSASGAVLLGINPVGTFILCMVPRILMGWLTGIIFRGMKKNDRLKSFSYVGASLAGPLLNTVLFMTTLVVFFYQTEYIQGIVEALNANNVITFVILFVGVNGLIEEGVNFVAGTAVSKTLDVYLSRTVK